MNSCEEFATCEQLVKVPRVFRFSFSFAFGLCMSKGEKRGGGEQVPVEDLPAGQELRDCQLEEGGNILKEETY